MAFLASNNIKVFPSSRRISTDDQFSRLVSESTLVSLINRLIDVEGFVITNPNSFTYSSSIEFNVYGYYFKVDDAIKLIYKIDTGIDPATEGDPHRAAPLPDGSRIYAGIRLIDIANSVSGLTYPELRYQDDVEEPGDTETIYRGVEFSTTPITSSDNMVETVKNLVILWKQNGTWEIPYQTLQDSDTPVNSRVRFNNDTISVYGIDGGVI